MRTTSTKQRDRLDQAVRAGPATLNRTTGTVVTGGQLAGAWLADVVEMPDWSAWVLVILIWTFFAGFIGFALFGKRGRAARRAARWEARERKRKLANFELD